MIQERKLNKAGGDVSTIVDRGLCTGCGGCAGVCPEQAIEMLFTQRGILVGQINRERCTSCGLCLRICPGVGINIPEYQERIFGETPRHPEIGNFVQTYAAYSENEKIRYHCQSGGLISTLLIDLLETGQVDGAIVTRWKNDNPISPETFIARNAKEILGAAKSKYCFVPAASSIGDILRTEGTYAFVGTGCQIHAMRKAEHVKPVLKNRIAAYFGLHCLSVFNNHHTELILGKYGIPRKLVSSFDYRSKEWRGWPCDMRIKLEDDTAVDISGLSSRLIPRPYFTPLRCVYCVDKLNELSDVSFGDCRIARVYGRKTIRRASYGNNRGISDVICRSRKGHAIVEEARRKGIIHTEPTLWKEVLRTTKVAEKKLALTHFKSHARILNIDLPDYGFISYPKKKIHRIIFSLLQPTSLVSSVYFRLMERAAGNGVVMGLLRLCPGIVLLAVSQLRERMTNFNVFSRSELDIRYVPRKVAGRRNRP